MQWMFLLGVASGMRSMTPIAVVCWFCWMGRLPVQGTWAAWAGHLVSVIVFTVLALGEYVGDTLPRTPDRTAPVPAMARLVFGMLAAAILAASYLEPIAAGIIFGGIGALIGTWGGLYARRKLSGWAGRDLPVALAGSAVALALSIAVAHKYASIIVEHPAVYVGMLTQHAGF